MSARAAIVTIGALLAIAAIAASASAQSSASALPACIGVSTQSVYVPYGYNHIVVVKNGCSRPATCSVATDVNPQATTIELKSGASTDVLTFNASPSQTFVAKVSCTLK